ncbi:hypothetical protein DPEC_G00256680 [Dallia pectoralis]|uniref:Uncharacterized protein n=1 Tax=Dallia pectoralis TaxID=75939 RepID=A0ACC2FQG8_DALPE|nr:hypothetical protein DPEC_G00256680 [Dallia pectoralis]
MSSDLERVSLNPSGANPSGANPSGANTSGANTSGVNPSGPNPGTGTGGRTLSANVGKLHNALNLLLTDPEREQFIHCLNVYHARRNVCDLVQTLKVILNTQSKRPLLPMLRLVIPRSDQLLFDQYTSEGLYLKTDHLPPNYGNSTEGFGDAVMPTTTCMNTHTPEQPLCCRASGARPGWDGSSTTVDRTAPGVSGEPVGEIRQVVLRRSRSNEGLGFSIRGGSEHRVGIYVSLVEPGTSAEMVGLRVGDQIVTVNDMLFDNVSHMEAVKTKVLPDMTGRNAPHQPSGTVSWVGPQSDSDVLARSISKGVSRV